ncbi:MAG: cytochrome c family protein [Parvibaculaceae bacterium]
MQAVDTFTLNKIAGWVLFTGLLVFGLNETAHIVYHAEKPEKPGMTVEVAEEAPADQGAGEQAAAVPIGQLLAKADPAKGQAAFKACQACHSIEKGGPNKVGPDLWGVIGRPIASHGGFAYSDALKAKSNESWTFESINTFVHAPKTFAPGTKMTYAGVKKDDVRADLLAYINSQSDSPQPLPAADAQPAPAEGQQQPAQGEQQAPAQGQQGEQAPAQGQQQAPAQGEQAPAQGQQQAPAQGQSEQPAQQQPQQ